MSDHLSTDDLLMIRDQIDHGTMTPEWRNRWAKLLATHDAQAATIQRVRDLLIPSFYDRAEANRLLNKIQAALDGGQE